MKRTGNSTTTVRPAMTKDKVIAPTFDVERVRADFPILSTKSHWPPAGLPRQRRDDAKAARGD
jgi:hypothetical protein